MLRKDSYPNSSSAQDIVVIQTERRQSPKQFRVKSSSRRKNKSLVYSSHNSKSDLRATSFLEGLIFKATRNKVLLSVTPQVFSTSVRGPVKMSRNSTRYTTIDPNRDTDLNKCSLRASQALSKPQLTIDQVTPELAAQIVKHYILPMFDDKRPKRLSKAQTSTVFGDLKLTETLANQLEELTNQFHSRSDELEQSI